MSKQRKKGWKRRRWTAEERKFLLDNYGKLPTSVIAKKLNRTEDTIRSNARNLGIKIKAFSPFTKEEVAFLAENYGKRPVCEIAAEMGRSDSSVEHKAMRLGITTVRVASRKYCIDCGKKLSSAAIYRNNVCRCVECNVEFRQDENHPNWKGGVSTLDSIVYVLLRPIWASRS